ncbi:hypothetical protein SCMU_14690 [Sinomonas cyclohexanicum]|uniref:Uncharacterized protein n=1 Tax=Sinomonas cyclohexanicum TaxID=322009 RepID=A0ABM7PTY3_SINCY|nr:hypothetical protein [Corynebacterium cyclohexanicum]BCT75627.1 hypothetical protein SCMU_14690 [Corynebacterium cyclohexanicum]
MSVDLFEAPLAGAVAVPACEAAGHGEDPTRHDTGPARWYVRNLHPCWGRAGDLIAVCQSTAVWMREHREDVGRCPVCGEVRALEDWAYVAKGITE